MVQSKQAQKIYSFTILTNKKCSWSKLSTSGLSIHSQ